MSSASRYKEKKKETQAEEKVPQNNQSLSTGHGVRYRKVRNFVILRRRGGKRDRGTIPGKGRGRESLNHWAKEPPTN